MDDSESKADIGALLEVNRLDYRLPPSLSIATSRAMKVYKSRDQSYVAGTEQMQFTLSTGATYVDFLNSHLQFKVKMPTTLTAPNPKFSPHTGWANLIRQIRIIHSSGVELDRMKDSAGEWMQIQEMHNHSEAHRRVQSDLYTFNGSGRPSAPSMHSEFIEKSKEGVILDKLVYGDAAALAGSAYVALDQSGLEYDVCIPLAKLCGFFNVDLLAPSFLTAGLQIYIDFYTPEHFFQCGTTINGQQAAAGDPWPAGKALTLSNAEVHMETFTLTDSVVRKLSQISSGTGLEWYWDAVHQMNVTTNASSLSVQVTRALSRANNIIVKTRTSADLQTSVKDSFGSQPWLDVTKHTAAAVAAINGTMTEFQVQLGAQYIPSRHISDVLSFRHSTLKTFNTFRRSDMCVGVTGTEFTGFTDTAPGSSTLLTWFNGCAVAAVPLESSSTLQQAGAAISAQRTAVVNMSWKSPSANRRVDVFVVYSKLATLFLDSVVVRS